MAWKIFIWIRVYWVPGFTLAFKGRQFKFGLEEGQIGWFKRPGIWFQEPNLPFWGLKFLGGRRIRRRLG